jgi:hypothetical protein
MRGPATPIFRRIESVAWAFATRPVGRMSCLFSCSRSSAVQRRTNHPKLIEKLSRGQIGRLERSPKWSYSHASGTAVEMTN